MDRQYIAIDLKSFYASVECRERGLDPLTTNLVVADASRTEKTICLAVSPSLKTHGISGRARLFEVVQRVAEVNRERRLLNGWRPFAGKSASAPELASRPDLELDYIVAPPRMAFYIDYSTRVYDVYLRYIAPEDIHVYSIDEVFIDATAYLKTYRTTAHDLAMKMIREVLAETGITATAGIGTNLYLAKIAMDIVAKHIPADKDGVRIAELDEMSYRRRLWSHKPLTDFWRVGRGTAKKLEQYRMFTMGDVARMSLRSEGLLYRLFGVNAELLIDHAWGVEPCTIADIKAYKPTTKSISSGQVLTCPYSVAKTSVVVMEMAEGLSLELLEKGLVTSHVTLTIGYDTESLRDPKIAAAYDGPVSVDRYGRRVPYHATGSANIGRQTSSTKLISDAIMSIFDRVVNPILLVRRLTVTADDLKSETEAVNSAPRQLDLFTDYEAVEREEEKTEETLSKERKVQETILKIKKQFGKNAILKGLNFSDGATARDRNSQIGGHKA